MSTDEQFQEIESRHPFIKRKMLGNTTYSTHILTDEGSKLLHSILQERGLVDWYANNPASYWRCEFRSTISLLLHFSENGKQQDDARLFILGALREHGPLE